jgi:hypothetical protein
MYNKLSIMDIVFSMTNKPLSYEKLITLYRNEWDKNKADKRKTSWSILSVIQENSCELHPFVSPEDSETISEMRDNHVPARKPWLNFNIRIYPLTERDIS